MAPGHDRLQLSDFEIKSVNYQVSIAIYKRTEFVNLFLVNCFGLALIIYTHIIVKQCQEEEYPSNERNNKYSIK